MSFSPSFAPPLPSIYGRRDVLLNVSDAVRDDALDVMEVCAELAPESRKVLLRLARNLLVTDQDRARQARSRSLLSFPVGAANNQ